MLTIKDEENCDYDFSSHSTTLSQVWYPSIIPVNNVTSQHSIETDTVAFPFPSRRNDEVELGSSDSNFNPPFAFAVPVSDRCQDRDEISSNADRPVPHTVEVDVETGTIRVEVEQKETIHVTTQESPVSNLSQSQQSWLIVFIRKWARKTGAQSRRAAKQCTPKMKRAVSRSAVAIKDASFRSASFIRENSAVCKDRAMELNQKHRLGAKARSSFKLVGRQVKQASKVTSKGVKNVSVTTMKGVKELEEKHHIMRKSKRTLLKSGNIIRKVWNGKPRRGVSSDSSMQAPARQDVACKKPKVASE